MAQVTMAPGVERFEAFGGDVLYFGTAEALRAASLIPADGELPGDRPGKRGVRWIGSDGRRWRLSKEGKKQLRLVRVASQRDRLAYENEERRERRLMHIDKALSTWGESKEQLTYAMTRCIDRAFEEIGLFALRDSPGRGPWVVRDAADLHLVKVAVFELVRESVFEHDTTWRQRLEHERVMLAE